MVIALVIARRQHAQSEAQGTVIADLEELARSHAEGLEDLRQQLIDADPTDDELPDAEVSADEPTNPGPLVEKLRASGAKLDWSNLVWRKKMTNPPTRGNYGWFVYSDVAGERWFVHSGRVITARRAVPQERLNAWSDHTRLRPEDIRIDYQVGTGRGSHSWYVETYGGRTWRLSKGGKGVHGVTVTELPEGAS